MTTPQKDFSAPLRLAVRPSWRLAGLLLALHGAALMLILPLPLPAWGKLLPGGAVLASALITLNVHALLYAKRAVVRLTWEGDGLWRLRTAAGREYTARLLPGSYANAALVILNFALHDSRWRRRSVVLLPDAVDATTLRQLRVRLRMKQ